MYRLFLSAPLIYNLLSYVGMFNLNYWFLKFIIWLWLVADITRALIG